MAAITSFRRAFFMIVLASLAVLIVLMLDRGYFLSGSQLESTSWLLVPTKEKQEGGRTVKPVHKQTGTVSPLHVEKQEGSRDVKPVHKQDGTVFLLHVEKQEESRDVKPVHKQDGTVSPLHVEKQEGDRTVKPVHKQAGRVSPLHVEPMVLSLSYEEQSANALSSMMNLQCWANSVNMSKVVEPSITPNFYSTFKFVQDKKFLKFRDFFDIDHWNQMSISHNFSSLASMEYFLKHAVKEVVYVHIKYEWKPIPCKKKQKLLTGFSVIRSVCIDFANTHVWSESAFRDSIFHGIGNNVTIVFNEWRGIRDSGRVALKEKVCRNCLNGMIRTGLSKSKPSAVTYSPLNSTRAAIPSQRIQKYIDRFLLEHLSGEKYVAIMLRTEKIMKPLLLQKNHCASEIISDWKAMVEGNNITKTLFFSDIGKHGSTGWHDSTAKRFSQRIHDAAHVFLTLDKMNSILEGITGSGNSVQIALLHQQLVARATCVVVVGGGSFQSQTLNHYAHLHRGHECYIYRGGSDCLKYYITAVAGQEL